MGALAKGENFHRLGPLRLEFMSLVSHPPHHFDCADQARECTDHAREPGAGAQREGHAPAAADAQPYDQGRAGMPCACVCEPYRPGACGITAYQHGRIIMHIVTGGSHAPLPFLLSLDRGRIAGVQPVRAGDRGPAPRHPGPRPLRDSGPRPGGGGGGVSRAADAAGASGGARVLRRLRQVQLGRPQGGVRAPHALWACTARATMIRIIVCWVDLGL
jgi:hypothetical protein